jgi:hypothetical protein
MRNVAANVVGIVDDVEDAINRPVNRYPAK